MLTRKPPSPPTGILPCSSLSTPPFLNPSLLPSLERINPPQTLSQAFIHFSSPSSSLAISKTTLLPGWKTTPTTPGTAGFCRVEAAIAARYSTTLSDLMTVNAMGTSAITPGDILAIPLAACASGFSRFATDAGLIVANGSYAITASHCVQCSCGPANMNLFCTPAPLASSCTSMQCRNSNLVLGNFSAQPSSAGCSVSSCSYSGFVNGTIMTTLSISLQPRCPGSHTFPPLLAPPTVLPISAIASSPSPSPSQAGGPTLTPRSSTTGVAGSIPGTLPAAGPSGSTSDSSSLTYPLCHILTISVLHLLLRLIG